MSDFIYLNFTWVQNSSIKIDQLIQEWKLLVLHSI